ncbi:unnamed protein product [marine sediment metagenome]|uniref:DUF362 domain-containing protein n=1 Tax=marine sediment metagenome TaxID=412755 RepID=X1E0I0_9ZZZZ
MSKLSLVINQNREEGTVQAIDLLGENKVEGKNVVLKPNFNTADPAPGSTDIITLRSLIVKLKEMGAKSITLAERSGPVDTRKCMEEKGIFELAEELDFQIINLAEVGVEEYIHIRPKDSYWKDGFLFAKIYHGAECIVETCCLKTHQYGGHFTLSLKNAVGIVPKRDLNGNSYMRELHSSPDQRKLIADINSAFSPDLIVLDGVTAFVDGGPAVGTRKEANVILASKDRIAIDAVGVAILRILGTTTEVNRASIFEQEQIARAVELNLGVAKQDEIEIITDSKEAEKLAEQIMTKLQE